MALSTDKISPEALKEMYWQRKISSPRIAKIYGCRPEFIRALLRKYKIRIRTKSEARKLLFGVHISKTQLEVLYQNKKLGSVGIAERFGCSASFIRKKLKEYSIPIRSYGEALALSNKSPYPQKDFSGELEEKAYIMGFSKGDLWVYSASKLSPTVFIQTNSTIPEFIRLVENLFSPYGYIRKSNPAKNGAICIRCSLNRSFDFLLGKKDSVDSWILENTGYFAAFLAGYVDAEGTFCLCGGNGVFSIRSQDKFILHSIYAKLINLGILLRPPQLVRKKGTVDAGGTISNKDIFAVFVYRKDAILKLINLIKPYLKHEQKIIESEVVKNNIIERNKKYNNRQDRKWYKVYRKENINYVRS